MQCPKTTLLRTSPFFFLCQMTILRINFIPTWNTATPRAFKSFPRSLPAKSADTLALASTNLPYLRLRRKSNPTLLPSPFRSSAFGATNQIDPGLGPSTNPSRPIVPQILKSDRRSGMSKLGGAFLAFLVAFFYAGASPAKASSPEEDFVKKAVSSHEVVIFSKSYCPYCRRAKAVFKELNKSPHVIELDERDDGSDIQEALSDIVGRRTVPQVFINGKHIGGSDDTVDAYESGRLAKLLGVASKDDL